MENRFKTTPYKHQLDCLNRFGRREFFALCADPGTGKTWIMINNLADLYASDDVDAALIFAPNGVHENWTRLEIPKHMPDWVPHKAHAWVSGGGKKSAKKLFDFMNYDGKRMLKILTMNWAALTTMRGREVIEAFCNAHHKLAIICDESDAIKNPSAVRTKALMKLKKRARYRRIVTGTPVNNSPFDLFTQYTFLDDGILQTTNFYAFRSTYADILGARHPLTVAAMRSSGAKFPPQLVARDRNGRPMYRDLDKLHALIEPHTFRVTKEQCLDLPEKVYSNSFFDLTPEQSDVYEKAEQECRLVFEDHVSAFTKLVAVGKLSQICSGYFLHPQADEPVRIPGENPKLKMLIERVTNLVERGEKIIIWARYRIEIADIVIALREAEIAFVEYHGGVSDSDRKTAIDSFENGSAMVFVGNQQTAGVGITLIAASNVIYFSNSFSLRDRVQSEDRAHRIGQAKTVTYINLVAKDTIDEKIVATLSQKKSVADAIIDGAIWR